MNKLEKVYMNNHNIIIGAPVDNHWPCIDVQFTLGVAADSWMFLGFKCQVFHVL